MSDNHLKYSNLTLVSVLRANTNTPRGDKFYPDLIGRKFNVSFFSYTEDCLIMIFKTPEIGTFTSSLVEVIEDRSETLTVHTRNSVYTFSKKDKV